MAKEWLAELQLHQEPLLQHTSTTFIRLDSAHPAPWFLRSQPIRCVNWSYKTNFHIEFLHQESLLVSAQMPIWDQYNSHCLVNSCGVDLICPYAVHNTISCNDIHSIAVLQHLQLLLVFLLIRIKRIWIEQRVQAFQDLWLDYVVHPTSILCLCKGSTSRSWLLLYHLVGIR